jgi:Putative phage serine protease XkdF
MSLLSFLSALRKDTEPLDAKMEIDADRLWNGINRRILSKDSPATGDVHVSTTGGKKKPKPQISGNDNDEDDHLPVTNMTLAAQQITGQKPAQKYAEVLKVDESLGLVLGWAIVCKRDGCDYFDLQEDHIPEASMLAAAVDFMQNSRVAKEMHSGETAGSVVFAFPLTEDIAKAFGIESKTTGLMIAMKPDSDEMLSKFRDGTFTGFSIGGYRLEDEDV